ncbi:hypothetical protein D3M70_16260 [Pseudomonas sp. LS-2]|nr:hypothetical protein D3M70_16260 [Pseudomonas sp. LS-2]
MTTNECWVYRRRAWALAFCLWIAGAVLIGYAHISLPSQGWGVWISYLMYFLEFWYLLGLGEMHRWFYSLFTRDSE